MTIRREKPRGNKLPSHILTFENDWLKKHLAESKMSQKLKKSPPISSLDRDEPIDIRLKKSVDEFLEPIIDVNAKDKEGITSPSANSKLVRMFQRAKQEKENNQQHISKFMKKATSPSNECRQTGIGSPASYIARARNDPSSHFHEISEQHLFLDTSISKMPKVELYSKWDEKKMPAWDGHFKVANVLVQSEEEEALNSVLQRQRRQSTADIFNNSFGITYMCDRPPSPKNGSSMKSPEFSSLDAIKAADPSDSDESSKAREDNRSVANSHTSRPNSSPKHNATLLTRTLGSLHTHVNQDSSLANLKPIALHHRHTSPDASMPLCTSSSPTVKLKNGDTAYKHNANVPVSLFHNNKSPPPLKKGKTHPPFHARSSSSLSLVKPPQTTTSKSISILQEEVMKLKKGSQAQTFNDKDTSSLPSWEGQSCASSTSNAYSTVSTMKPSIRLTLLPPGAQPKFHISSMKSVKPRTDSQESAEPVLSEVKDKLANYHTPSKLAHAPNITEKQLTTTSSGGSLPPPCPIKQQSPASLFSSPSSTLTGTIQCSQQGEDLTTRFTLSGQALDDQMDNQMPSTAMLDVANSLWQVLTSAFRHAGKSIVYGDILELANYKKVPELLSIVLGYICRLLGVKPTWQVAKLTLLSDCQVFLDYLQMGEPLLVPMKRLEAAMKFKQEFFPSVDASCPLLGTVCKHLPKLMKWVESFHHIAQLIISVKNHHMTAESSMYGADNRVNVDSDDSSRNKTDYLFVRELSQCNAILHTWVDFDLDTYYRAIDLEECNFIDHRNHQIPSISLSSTAGTHDNRTSLKHQHQVPTLLLDDESLATDSLASLTGDSTYSDDFMHSARSYDSGDIDEVAPHIMNNIMNKSAYYLRFK